MKERPIIFSAYMIRAILYGRKSQTRRVVKPQPKWVEKGAASIGDRYWDFGWAYIFDNGHVHTWNDNGIGGENWNANDYPKESRYTEGFLRSKQSNKCPYGQPGDRLLVAKEIPGLPDTYCAGSDGQIYSKARGEWRPLKAWRNQKGYEVVTLWTGKKLTRHVHHLVCWAFYGDPKFANAQVRHLDGNPENGLPENLSWGTQEENWQDRKAHGNGIEGEKHHASKFTDKERSHIRWAIERGLCSQRHAARVLGVSQSAIWEMLDGAELHEPQVTDPGPRIPRITLEIVNIRVERLRDISWDDAIAEGWPYDNPGRKFRDGHDSATGDFSEMWDSMHSKDGFGWDENPWVWVISFKKV